MADFTLRDWFELPPRLLMHPPFALMVPAAVSAVCAFYHAFPEETDAIVSDSPLPSGSTGYLMPRICGLPPAGSPQPQRPFTGGQCCELYEVVVEHVSLGQTSQSTYSNVPGKIGRVVTDISESNGTRSRAFYFTAGLNCPLHEPGRYLIGSEVRSDQLHFTNSGRIVSVTRTDGQPDNCGNPLPVYPPGNPTPEDFDMEITVNIGGDDYTFPVEILPPEPAPDYPTRPEINIQVGDTIININGDGFTIGNRNPSPSLPPASPDPRSPGERPPTVPRAPLFPDGTHAPPASNPDNPGNPGNCPDVNLAPVLSAIANVDADLKVVGDNVILLLDCDRCKPEEGEEFYEKVSYASAQSREISLPSFSRYVELIVDEMPSNAKVQYSPSAQNVYYCGWRSFGKGNRYDERIPVHYEKNVFMIPEGMNTFSYTLYDAFSATLTVFIEGTE